MKKSFAPLIGIMSIALLPIGALGQPAVQGPHNPNVPQVTEQQVPNPKAPHLPNAVGPRPLVPMAKPNNYCSCPTTFCASGDLDSCEIYCQTGKTPVCSCDGYCDGNNNPQGTNRCDCQ